MQASVHGVSLSYESQGDGPAVVFVHGLGATANVWHAQRMTLSRYFRVVTFDLSGSGRSGKSRGPYSFDVWADELAGLIDHLHLPDAVVVGHSMGTFIAQRFAARRPEKARALVLAGALTELAALVKEAYAQRAALVEREGMAGVADVMLGTALSAGTRERNLALTGLVREMYLANDPASYAGHCRALAAGSAREDQPKITCRTLLVVGDQDAVAPLGLQQQIAAAIAGAVIRVVPNTAHMTMLETPEAFNAILLEFLATL
jgi:pimeloyl-ACP methyl ester carboxylesterase